ncbi:MAG: putative metal-binding motif-containing protein, partial [Deltaproteobacteria bacterium]|nr:putative metal-binding motif-containing protein [Deltaproteobacteria bacterium]
GKDNDQNGAIDDGAGDTWYRDSDGDGYGDPTFSQQSCTQPAGYVENSSDCNDNNADEHPGQIWYRDADGDGYPSADTDTDSCQRPQGYLLASELIAVVFDADDNDNTVYPGAFEICDGKDNDQDGFDDEECGIVFVSGNGDCDGRPACYQTICAGYGYATAWDAGEIRVRDDFFIENLYLENDLLFTLSGGWNSDFSSNQGEQTSVSGTLTITAGTVIVEGIVLEGPATFTQLRKY